MDNNMDNICFFIAPIGDPGTTVRKHSDDVLRHIVRAAASRFGFEAIRADEIAKPGIITSQVIEHVVDSPIVIADLTGHNPNVFYELAIRHAIRKPFVQMIRKDEGIPFDVATARTVVYELDLDGAANAADEVARHIQSLIDDPSDLETPISVTLDLQSLRSAADQENSGLRHVLPLLEDINSAVHNNSNEISRLRDTGVQTTARTAWNSGIHRTALESQNPYGFIASIGSMRSAYPWIYELGRAAYTRVLAGDANTGAEIFVQTISLIQARYAPESGFVTGIAPELQLLFDRLVSSNTSGYGTNYTSNVDDLPF